MMRPVCAMRTRLQSAGVRSEITAKHAGQCPYCWNLLTPYKLGVELRANTPGTHHMLAYHASFLSSRKKSITHASTLVHSSHTHAHTLRPICTQGGIPYLLGSLVDLQHIDWVVELSKYLMLNDDDYGGSPVDFTVMGWCMAQ
eukprot:scaffold13533_cov20-Tisochrysis_lutea.AAC.1